VSGADEFFKRNKKKIKRKKGKKKRRENYRPTIAL
jgi:hypothetical protein